MLTSVSRTAFICGLFASTSALAQPPSAPLASAAGVGVQGAPTGAGGDNIASQPTTLNEIVVTAQKREQSINSVPESITAATGDQLRLAGVTQVRDLTKLVPGFTYADSAAGTPIYTLRGIGFVDVSLAGRPTVSVYEDQAPIPFAIETRGANLDVDRVEVLKGPQGTLFGSNATGGAINFVAAKPTNTFQAGTDLSYGRFNSVDASGFVSGPVANTLNARLAVQHIGSDDWQQSYTTGQRTGGGDFTNARLLLDWKPISRLSGELNINGWLDNSKTQAAQLIAITPQSTAPGATFAAPGLLTYPLSPSNDRSADFTPGEDYRRHNFFIQINGRFDYRINDNLTLTSITSASHYKEQQLVDEDGTTLQNASFLTFGRITSVYEELRLAGAFATHGHFTIGADYGSDTTAEKDFGVSSQSVLAGEFVPLGLPLFKDFDVLDNQDENTAAAFGSFDYDLTSSINIYGGARFTQANDNFNGGITDAGDDNASSVLGAFDDFLRSEVGLAPVALGPGAGLTLDSTTFTPGVVHSRLDENNISWRAGAQWKPVRDTLLYFNVSKGYKAGGYSQIEGSFSSQYDPARQESVLAYEGGFKSTLVEHTLQLTGALFYYDYDNKQILGRIVDPTFGALIKLVNIPKSDEKGAELQVDWTPLRGLTLSGGASWLYSRIDGTFDNFDPFGVALNLHDESFPNAPRWQAIANAQYVWGLTSRLDGVVGGNASYQGATNSQLGASPLTAIRSYTLVDLRGGVQSKDGAWRFLLWGRNVGNTYYWTAANHVSDTTVRFTGMPVTYGATVSYRFR